MIAESRPRILCVDDEPRVLQALLVILRQEYEVISAESGDAALKTIERVGDIAVVCSDMRMPGMTGAALLKQVMQDHPSITRILLTGDPGPDSAVNAVNEGQIFRFLTKPCPPDKLKAAIDAGVKQHRLINSERVLLQETLLGCIKALTDALALMNPAAFGRATRIKRLAVELAEDLRLKDPWQLEAAALLSQLGYLSVSAELAEKIYFGKALTPEEKSAAAGVPEIARKLLGHIPRLEPVLQMLALENLKQPKSDADAVAQGMQILSLVLRYDGLSTQGLSALDALQNIVDNAGDYPPALVEKLRGRVLVKKDGDNVKRIPLWQVKNGMILLDDLKSETGVLLAPQGCEISDSFTTRMKTFSNPILRAEVRVAMRDPLKK